MLHKIAQISYKHRWIVVGLWLGLLVSITFLAQKYGSNFSSEFKTKSTDSQQATDILQQRFPAVAGGTGQIVYSSQNGVTNPTTEAQMQQLFSSIAAIPHVQSITSPYSPMGVLQISPNKQIAFATIQFDQNYQNIPASTITSINNSVNNTRIPGVTIDMGGDLFEAQTKAGSTEGIGLIAAVFILLISFGSVLAMGLPIMMALFGVGIGVAFVELLSHVIPLPNTTVQLASMIGIGVGIDYALFIVTRYRQELKAGHEPELAVVTSINTAGRSVLFAGTTVVISLLGMLLIGIGFISGMGIGAASVVAVSMLASITLLPAVLGFVGHSIDKLSIPTFGKPKPKEAGMWYRWSRFLQRRPWPAMLAGLIILLALAYPALSMRLGSSDASSRPTSDTTRRAYDLISQGFGVGANGPLLVVAKINGQSSLPALQKLQAALAQTPGVASVTPPIPNQQLNAAVLQVIPTTSPQAAETTDLIHNLRSNVVPNATQGTNIVVHIGGITAAFDDLATILQDRLPIFIGIVLLLSFCLLLLVFRSFLVPLKAVLMNLLSIGAAYGVLVLIFQKGYGAHLLGLGKTGPIESFVPMIMFAILFGLSMDYEVFLLSRIKEEYDRTGNNADAVADGLYHTARVITAAAAIMVTVFSGFMLDNNRVIKEFGLGLAVAVLLDATVVRMMLVPATMELLGKANWWYPKWLKFLPQLHIDGNDVYKKKK
jgi:RND superfamily putative drug exporter